VDAQGWGCPAADANRHDGGQGRGVLCPVADADRHEFMPCQEAISSQLYMSSNGLGMIYEGGW
jgi:hypothetical protein